MSLAIRSRKDALIFGSCREIGFLWAHRLPQGVPLILSAHLLGHMLWSSCIRLATLHLACDPAMLKLLRVGDRDKTIRWQGHVSKWKTVTCSPYIDTFYKNKCIHESFHISLNIYYSNQSISIPSIIHPVQWSALQSSSPICHCQALPQALTQALKVMWFGSTRFFGLSIWSTTSKEYSHCQDAQQALIMVLKPDCCPAWAKVKNPSQTRQSGQTYLFHLIDNLLAATSRCKYLNMQVF